MVTVCFALFFAMVAACLAAGWSVAWALLGGLVLFWLLGLRLGFTWGQLWEMAWAKCRKSLIVVRIILLIGVITGVWRCGGTIACCIVWGVGLATPRLFLALAFLLCAAFSYVLGTSYGVSSTLGVILMALARSGGVDPAVAAGVILSGVYFGDRCSPASSAASLVAAVTGTDLYRNVGRMLRTGALPTLLTLGAYLVLSQLHPLSQVDGAVLSALSDRFVLSWWTLLPAAVMFLLPLLKVPIQWTILISSGLSAVIAALVQGFSPAEILSAAWGGYRPEDPALADRTGRFPAMIAVSVLCAAVLCNQAVTSMMGEQVLGGAYQDREELAMDIENSGILIAGLIPWSIACSIPLAMLGADASALPYALLLWLIPLCYLFTKKRYYSAE